MNLKRVVPWTGEVNPTSLSKVMEQILKLHGEDQESRITMPIVSGGGASSAGFAFFDLILSAGLPLDTIASGFVDSIAIIVFLSGENRMVTPHTTMQFHEGQRRFGPSDQLTRKESEAMIREGELYDDYYVDVVCGRTSIKEDEIRRLISSPHVLTPQEMLDKGIAHKILLPGSL